MRSASSTPGIRDELDGAPCGLVLRRVTLLLGLALLLCFRGGVWEDGEGLGALLWLTGLASLLSFAVWTGDSDWLELG